VWRLCGTCQTVIPANEYVAHRQSHHGSRNGSTYRWRQLRQVVLARDGHRCVICGSTQRLEVDHIQPVAAGGTDDPRNLRTVCFTHNPRGARPTQQEMWLQAFGRIG
jgi:5-methylcytosine-specific restriction endonuclease McrA